MSRISGLLVILAPWFRDAMQRSAREGPVQRRASRRIAVMRGRRPAQPSTKMPAKACHAVLVLFGGAFVSVRLGLQMSVSNVIETSF